MKFPNMDKIFPRYKITKDGFGKYRAYRRCFFWYNIIRDVNQGKWVTVFPCLEWVELAISRDIYRRAEEAKVRALQQESVIAVIDRAEIINGGLCTSGRRDV